MCTAAVVMENDPAFDQAPAVRTALAPFYDAYLLPHYDEATVVATLLAVAAQLDAQEAARVARLAAQRWHGRDRTTA